MGRHNRQTPQQKADEFDATFDASKTRAEAKRAADPLGEATKPLTIKGKKGGSIGISADGQSATSPDGTTAVTSGGKTSIFRRK